MIMRVNSKRFRCKTHGILRAKDTAYSNERPRCNICKKAWRELNSNYLKEKWREYYEANSKKIKKKQAIYYKENKEYYARKKREYRERDKQ